MATAVGQKLEVFASKTEAQALALASTNPGAICFTTDKKSIVFNGAVYSLTAIVNALTDSSTDKALSAAQGKALKALIDALPTTEEMNEAIDNAVITTVGSVYRVKGTKANISDVLALTDAKVGDVWNVTNEFTLSSKKYPAGTNVVCTTATSSSDHDDGNWDALGGSVDLSLYLTVATAASTYLKKADVVNNLTTSTTGKALDASQGKVLKDLVDKNNVYDSAFDADMVVPKSIGGIPANTKVSDLEGNTLSEMFDKLIFPEIQPTVNNPSASLTFASGFSSNGIYEVGATAPAANNFTKTFNRGSCTVVGQPTKYRAGAETSSSIYVNGSPSTTTLPTKITLGTMQYNYKVNYGQGDKLLTSWGNDADTDPNPLPAGSVTSGALYIYGTYPYYCNGQSASTSNQESSLPTTVTANTKLPLKKWTDTLIGAKFASEASTGTRLVFEFPSTKKVTKVEFMNTVSGKWETFASTNYTTSSAGNKTVQGTEVAYTKLTTTGSLSGALQLRFTIADSAKSLMFYDADPVQDEYSDDTPQVFAGDSEIMPLSTGNRAQGVASFAVNFEPGGQTPLDARSIVPTKADLIAADTYSAKNYYKGMLVAVVNTQELYMLKDPSKITSSDYSGWTKVSNISTQVINNLTSDSTTAALSAAQGKALNTKITALTGALIRRGSKNNIAEVIAITNAKVGDVWNVVTEFELNGSTYPAGTDVVCITATTSGSHTAANWDAIGGKIKEDWDGIVKLDGIGTATTIESSTTSTAGGKLYYNTSTKKIYYAVGGKNYTDWNLSGQTNPVLNDRSLACDGTGKPIVNRLYIIGSSIYYFDGTNMTMLTANASVNDIYKINGLGNITINSTNDNLKTALNGVDAFCKAVEANKVFIDTNVNKGGAVILSAEITGLETSTTVKLSAYIRSNNSANSGISIRGEFVCNRTAGTITSIPVWENTYTEDIYPIYAFPTEAPDEATGLKYFGKPSNFEKAYDNGYRFILSEPQAGVNGNAMLQHGVKDNIIIVTKKADADHNFLLSKISISTNTDGRVITKQTSIQLEWNGTDEKWTGFFKAVDDEVLLLGRCIDNLTSTSKYPLTANQGKVLKTYIDESLIIK